VRLDYVTLLYDRKVYYGWSGMVAARKAVIYLAGDAGAAKKIGPASA
jgi:hypothetical protein